MINKFSKINSFLNKHWYITAFIYTIQPILFFLISSEYGIKFGFIKQNNSFILFGKIIIIIYSISYIIIGIFKIFGDKYFNDKVKKNFEYIINEKNFKIKEYKSNSNILKNILNSIVQICMFKYKEFQRNIIDDNQNKSLKSTTNPHSQIECILNELCGCLTNIIDINSNDISITILYKFKDSIWKWYNIADNQAIDLETLTTHSNTSANKIIQGKNLIFYPDKNKAVQNREYLPSNKDERYKNTGSVLCKDISIQNDINNKFVNAILCINTYGKQLCHDNQKEKEILLNTIIASFVKILKIELSLSYIEHKNNNL